MDRKALRRWYNGDGRKRDGRSIGGGPFRGSVDVDLFIHGLDRVRICLGVECRCSVAHLDGTGGGLQGFGIARVIIQRCDVVAFLYPIGRRGGQGPPHLGRRHQRKRFYAVAVPAFAHRLKATPPFLLTFLLEQPVSGGGRAYRQRDYPLQPVALPPHSNRRPPLPVPGRGVHVCLCSSMPAPDGRLAT